jgi:hypothetical protein
MKRLIIILLLLLPLAGVAKGGEFSDFVKRYSGQKGFTTVELSSQMLATMGVGDGIESMYAISVEDSTKVADFCTDSQTLIGKYNKLMSFLSDGKSVSIYSRNSSAKTITHLIIFISSDSQATLVLLYGTNIELSDVLSERLGVKPKN